MSFDKIMQEIKKQRQFAADTLEDATPQTLNGRKGRKDMAKFRLADLFFDYRQHMRSRVLAILVIGERADEFQATVEQTEAKMASLDGEALYAGLASKLDKRLLEKGESANYVLDVASRYLEETASEIGVKSYNQMVYKNKYSGKITNLTDAQNLIRKVMREQVGPEMNALFLLDGAARMAFEEEFDGKIYPVMIKVKSEENLRDLVSSLSSLGNKAIVVSTEESLAKDLNPVIVEEITEKSVISALKKVKQKASKGQ